MKIALVVPTYKPHYVYLANTGGVKVGITHARKTIPLVKAFFGQAPTSHAIDLIEKYKLDFFTNQTIHLDVLQLIAGIVITI